MLHEYNEKIEAAINAYFLWVPRALNLWKNKKIEYVHQVLDGNIEPPIYENHNRMQIITSLTFCMHIINFFVWNIMHSVHIWQKSWIRLEILGKNYIIFLMVWPLFLKLWVFADQLKLLKLWNIKIIKIMIIKLYPIYWTPGLKAPWKVSNIMDARTQEDISNDQKLFGLTWAIWNGSDLLLAIWYIMIWWS